MEGDMGEKTFRQIKKCAEWLAWCLENGWPKESLDVLEALWWKYHGDEGERQAGASVVVQ